MFLLKLCSVGFQSGSRPGSPDGISDCKSSPLARRLWRLKVPPPRAWIFSRRRVDTGGVHPGDGWRRRLGSAALGLAYVASGRLDGFWELHLNSWDVTAGLLLVGEAGGWRNDFLAGEGLGQGGPVLACPKSLQAVLQKTACGRAVFRANR